MNVTLAPRTTYQHYFVLPFEKGLDPITISYYIKTYWSVTIPLAVLYLIGIFSLKAWMRKREAMPLKSISTKWNGLLALFSILGLIRTTEEFFFTVKDQGLTASICNPFTNDSVSAYWFLFFAVSKFFELGDTLLLALKKRHLSFLHCYHHAIVLVYVWQSGADEIASGRVFLWLNFLCHSLMYSYFVLHSLNYKCKPLAIYVTTVQIAQMIIGLITSICVFYIKTFTPTPCQQSTFNLYFCFSIYLSFAFLFIKFFFNAYCQKQDKVKEL
uniref:Elongation of very long chain fatty acids protein n=1 Tax=Rhabditophanes sp. KR3021 TaxID=114890 RepID=A0AC35U181_9BILA